MDAGSDAGSRFKAGERVMALCSGGAYAEQVLVLLLLWHQVYVLQRCPCLATKAVQR